MHAANSFMRPCNVVAYVCNVFRECSLFLLFQEVIIIIYNEEFFYSKILNVKSKDEALGMVDKEKAYKNMLIEINGKQRDISVIDKKHTLYKLQKNLLDNFLSNIPLPDNVCGFVKGKSYLDFLKVHCSKEYYLRIDIKDFFASIKVDLIKDVIWEYITINDIIKRTEISNALSNIVTYQRKLPQGAITSPQLSNIIFRRLDIRIRNYCRKFDIEYTRYADDLLFSSNNPHLHKDVFYKMLVNILKTINLRINKKKIKKSTNSIVLNGYVIKNKISLSRRKLRNINSLIYVFENSKGKKNAPKNFEEYFKRIKEFENISLKLDNPDSESWIRLTNYLAGYRSYLMSFSKVKFSDCCENYSRKIQGIENILDKLMEFNH